MTAGSIRISERDHAAFDRSPDLHRGNQHTGLNRILIMNLAGKCRRDRQLVSAQAGQIHQVLIRPELILALFDGCGTVIHAVEAEGTAE